MITNEQVLAWVKTLPVTADNYYAGVLNNKKDCSFGVYNAGDKRTDGLAIGGRQYATQAHGAKILVHWNKSTRETQDKAIALYEAIWSANEQGNITIGDCPVSILAMPYGEPVDVGCDENGICEYVIDFVIFYERS